jgi:multisubunit Na+/H+ antiporter MnhC subunit
MMPLWFFILLAIVVLVAVLLAISLAYRGRSSTGSQNTTIIERHSPADRETTVVEQD